MLHLKPQSMDITTINALVRNEPASVGHRNYKSTLPIMKEKEIKLNSEKQLAISTALISSILANAKIQKNELHIVAGCENFFDSTSFARNACMDMDTAYRFIAKDLTELSSKYPNCIIAPGSIYVSTPIPKASPDIKFSQDGRKQLLTKTTCYTSNLMPILFGGELLGIVRKGEKIKSGTIKTGAYLDEIDHISSGDADKIKAMQLSVTSYHEDSLTDLADATTSSTCYLGKTLLPGEKELIQKHFKTTPEKLFKHEYDIAGKRLMALVCGEFRSEDGASSSAKILQENSYDIIIHSTRGGGLPPELRNKGKIYIHADAGNDNQLYSKTLGKIDGELKESGTGNVSTIKYFQSRGWLNPAT